MTQSIAIIGAGISGLYAAMRLTEQQVDVTVFEARDRIGGRVLGRDGFDLGPTWYWPDTERSICSLIKRFELESFAQHTAGDMVLERQAFTATERHHLPPESITPSRRLVGGMRQLVEAIQATLPTDIVRLNHRAVAIKQTEHAVSLDIEREGTRQTYSFDAVILALPPRLVRHIAIEPALPEATQQHLRDTPTWMASHAKALLVYPRPFWREQGLSGFGMSWVGPLQEMHDASSTDGRGALFGFFRMDAATRRALGAGDVKTRVIEQLVKLYGPEAATFTAFHYVDWAQDPLTATAEDAGGLSAFPTYGPIPLQDRIHLIGSETDPAFGGHIEGALQSVERIVRQVNIKN